MSGRFQRGHGSFAELRRWKQHVPYGTVVNAGAVIPPFDTLHNVWAFDPDQVGAAQYQVGPTGTPTTPVKTAGPPAFYTFGATDRIDFGNALDSVWTGTAPQYTMYYAISPSAGDIAAAASIIACKDNGTTQRGWVCFLATGLPQFVAFNAINGSGAAVNRLATGTITAARHVMAIVIDMTQAANSRATVYLDGSPITLGSGGTETGTTIPTNTATLRVGERADALPPVSIESYTYAYSGLHNATVVGQITSWIQTTKGWV